MDPIADWRMINEELGLYDPQLLIKPQLVVLNKIDLPDARERQAEVKKAVTDEGFEFASISAVTGEGVRAMIFQIKHMLEVLPVPERPVGEPVIIRPAVDDRAFSIKRLGNNTWRVAGKEIERIASMTYFEFDDSLMRFQTTLEKSGISAALADAGVKVGDTVYIGDQELEWGE